VSWGQYPRSVESFDPDEEFGNYIPTDFDETLDEGRGIQIDRADYFVDAVRARDLLEEITNALPGGGERREGQLRMVTEVAEAISNGSNLVIEAGTGVGKSLAYLVPAALSKQRVIVATHTKNLQDQLLSKDVPALQSHIPKVKVEILKGKQNYVCRVRLNQVERTTQPTFDDGVALSASVTSQVRTVVDWSHTTKTGDLDELPIELFSGTRRALTVTPQECAGPVKCPQAGNCYHEWAKQRAASADIVIVNHSLYASHLASGKALLPSHDTVILDEAHEAEDVFASLLGTSVTINRIKALSGIVRPYLGRDFEARCNDLFDAAGLLADALDRQYNQDQRSGLIEDTSILLRQVSEHVIALTEALKIVPAPDGDGETAKARVLGPAQHLANDLRRLLNARPGELIYLTANDKEIVIELSIVDVGSVLREELWSEVSGVLTSATIADNVPQRLGIDGATFVRVDSPFDYPQQARLYVPHDAPDRKSPLAEDFIIEEIVTLLTAAKGRTLALFTSRRMMERAALEVSQRVSYEILVQNQKSRSSLIEEFREKPETSLFATASFWQGVDVPGQSLSLVIIDRLPFPNPKDPLLLARSQLVRRPFMELSVPAATMTLAQGAGRLIRNTTDRGVVAVLDGRLTQAKYGERIRRRLPPMPLVESRDEIVNYLNTL
jgi:ATP-dependent DNA helicase DinG